MMSVPTRVVKIGEDGSITFSMPDMVGQYLVVEERDGHIILSPYDLRWHSPTSSIAKLGAQLHYVRSESESLPEA
jgi:hypothetical protein